jgi:hypothetical protein
VVPDPKWICKLINWPPGAGSVILNYESVESRSGFLLFIKGSNLKFIPGP